MAIEMVVPNLGESVSTATVIKWLKKTGDQVERGEEIVELEADKGTFLLECPETGVLLAVLVDEEAVVEPGTLLAAVGESGEKWVRRAKASPRARESAERLGVNLAQVKPSRSGARITSEDVERFAEKNAGSSDSTSHVERLTATQLKTAEMVMRSAREIPQFSTTIEMDASAWLEAKEKCKLSPEGGLKKATMTALLVYATARLLDAHPLLNARYIGDGRIDVFDVRNIAVAVATDRGVILPVIRNAGRMTLPQIAEKLESLVTACRRHSASAEDMKAATFTVSNLGMFGIDSFTAMVPPGQGAIMTVGAVRSAPSKAPDSDSAGGSVVSITVTADHRILDGAAVAWFLATLKKNMENFSL